MTTADPIPLVRGDVPSGGRYTGVAIWLHWIVAALAVAILPVAWVFTALPEKSPRVGPLFQIHASLGISIWLLVVARVIWRLTHPAPKLGPRTPRWLDLVSKASHWLLYLAFFSMPLSGYTMVAASGHPVPFWGLTLPALPKSETLAKLADLGHRTEQWLVYALLIAHVGATAWHSLLRRDGVLQRMIPPQVNADTP